MYMPDFSPRLAYMALSTEASFGISLIPVCPSGDIMWATDIHTNMAMPPSMPASRMRLDINLLVGGVLWAFPRKTNEGSRRGENRWGLRPLAMVQIAGGNAFNFGRAQRPHQ